MATKQLQQVPYAAGIYADMSVDGPEIGTLVMVCDRAKNLPNRKTMGKQNPYCAARLGKEAKKTNVDKRGGQTPKWYVWSEKQVFAWHLANLSINAGTQNCDSQYTTQPITTASSYRFSARTKRQT